MMAATLHAYSVLTHEAIIDSAWDSDLKPLLLRRFPYAVVVRESAEEVLVIAFAHTARRPGYWRHRLKSGV